MELRFFYSDDTNYGDPEGFNRVTSGNTALTTVYDINDQSSPVNHVFSNQLISTVALSAGTSQSTSGDASWVHDDANRHGVRPNNTTFGWEDLPAGTYTVELYPLASGGDRTLEATLGGETKSLYCVNNFSEVIRFTGVTPTDGVIEADLATSSGSDGYAYLTASRIYSEGSTAGLPAFTLQKDGTTKGDLTGIKCTVSTGTDMSGTELFYASNLTTTAGVMDAIDLSSTAASPGDTVTVSILVPDNEGITFTTSLEDLGA